MHPKLSMKENGTFPTSFSPPEVSLQDTHPGYRLLLALGARL